MVDGRIGCPAQEQVGQDSAFGCQCNEAVLIGIGSDARLNQVGIRDRGGRGDRAVGAGEARDVVEVGARCGILGIGDEEPCEIPVYIEVGDAGRVTA